MFEMTPPGSIPVPETTPLGPRDPRQLGEYALLGKLGQGGMGTVYLGKGSDERLVAVKVIRAELASEPEFRQRFWRESENARRVARFCTAEVLYADANAEDPYLVTEYVPGPTLAAVVTGGGALTSANLERVALGVAAALTAIHGAGIVHRDLKPSNVLLSSFGPRVIDFGIARALDTTTALSQDLSRIGTPAYMSPEQARGEKVTPISDIFAWGAVVAYAGTGRHPFGEGPVTALLYRVVNEEPNLEGLHEPLLSIVRTAMNKNPAMRPTASGLLLRLAGDPGPGVEPSPAVTQILGGWVQPEQGPGDLHAPASEAATNLVGGSAAVPAAESFTAATQRVSSDEAATQRVGGTDAAARGGYPAPPGYTGSGQPGGPGYPNQGQPSYSGQYGGREPATQLAGTPPPGHRAGGIPDTGGPSTPAPGGPGTGQNGKGSSGARIGLIAASALAVVAIIVAVVLAVGGGDKKKNNTATPAATGGPASAAVSQTPPAATTAPGQLPTSATPLSDQDIVFASDRGGAQDIYVARSDGSDVRRLTRGGATNTLPVLSKDRRTVLYFESRTQTIKAMGADGSGLKTLSWKGIRIDSDARPSLSPDEKSVAVTASGLRLPGIYVLSLDGSQPPRRLPTKGTRVKDPAFSPDGKSVAYWSDPQADGGKIVIVAADGQSEPMPITGGGANALDADPTWSPDGSKIAFRRTQNGNRDVWVMQINGSGQTRLTTASADDQDPAYSPDGSQIAFSSERDGNREIYLMGADGTNETRITTSPATDTAPSWDSR